MSAAQICIMATIILYLCFVIFTGVMIGRRSKKSAEGFYLGGRGIGPLVTAMSAEASDMSSYLLMGIPGPPSAWPRAPTSTSCWWRKSSAATA